MIFSVTIRIINGENIEEICRILHGVARDWSFAAASGHKVPATMGLYSNGRRVGEAEYISSDKEDN